jgi:GntR family transcriptional regulator, arabinose operon transcriptional repressor
MPGTAAPRYLRIKEVLVRQIRAGRWAEGQYISTEKQIGARFSVSRITARRVLDELQRDGYVTRARAKGSRLVSRTGATERQFVHLLSPSEEHLQNPLDHGIVAGFQKHGFQTLSHSLGLMSDEAAWVELLALKPSAIIVQSGGVTERERLSRLARPALCTLLVIPDGVGDAGVTGSIETDLAHGARLAVQHCARQGYRGLAYYTYPLKPGQWSHLRHEEALRGACQEFGLTYRCFDIWRLEPHAIEEGIAEMLRAVGKGCAIVGDSDFRLSHVYRIARDLGWRIPQDLGLVGYYNTPWAESLSLTSIDVQKEVLAQQAVDFIVKGGQGRVMVTPTLVVRNSTCGPAPTGRGS